jgi:hypothetical protein
MQQLLRQAVALLVSAWTSATLAPLDMCGSMACVMLPGALARRTSSSGAADSADAKYIQVGGGAGLGEEVPAGAGWVKQPACLAAWVPDCQDALGRSPPPAVPGEHHGWRPRCCWAQLLDAAPRWPFCSPRRQATCIDRHRRRCWAPHPPPLPPQDLLHHEHNIECPVKCLGGALYVRISAAPYNVLADYEALAQAVGSIAAAQAAAS